MHNHWYLVIGFLALSIASCGVSTRIITGPPGPAGIAGPTGTTGDQGDPGNPGTNGQDGQSCSVTQVLVGDAVLPNGGAVVTCGVSSVLISNGAKGDQGGAGSNGTNGANGQAGHDGQDAPATAMSITEIIDPCGNTPGLDDEVFLLLANGDLLWLEVDNGSALTARLSLARDGAWVTTDGSGCNFTLTTVGGQRTIAWSGGGKTWTLQ